MLMCAYVHMWMCVCVNECTLHADFYVLSTLRFTDGQGDGLDRSGAYGLDCRVNCQS